jgi:glutathione S-transferase
MSAPDVSLRVFSYLPNPRLAKATIAARLCGVRLEVRGSRSRELAGWLWDFDARPLGEGEATSTTRRAARTGFAGELHKTDAFLDAHPFGSVPAAFSPDGKVGIFESNAIARAVVRLAPRPTRLYGDDPYGASRVDAFLDASLVFAREAQMYLLELGSGRIRAETRERAWSARDVYLSGIDRALAPDRRFLVGDALTLADVVFATELALFSAERASRRVLEDAGLEPLFSDALATIHPRALAHFERLCAHEAFAPDLRPYLEKLERSVLGRACPREGPPGVCDALLRRPSCSYAEATPTGGCASWSGSARACGRRWQSSRWSFRGGGRTSGWAFARSGTGAASGSASARGPSGSGRVWGARSQRRPGCAGPSSRETSRGRWLARSPRTSRPRTRRPLSRPCVAGRCARSRSSWAASSRPSLRPRPRRSACRCASPALERRQPSGGRGAGVRAAYGGREPADLGVRGGDRRGVRLGARERRERPGTGPSSRREGAIAPQAGSELG